MPGRADFACISFWRLAGAEPILSRVMAYQWPCIRAEPVYAQH